MIIMIYLFCVGYSCSWGPVPWLWMSEIFPTRIRDYGTTVGAATQWAFNYMFTKVVPYAVANIGWRVFIMFGILNFFNMAFAFFLVKETTAVSLEDMDALFENRPFHKRKPKNLDMESVTEKPDDEKIEQL